MQLSNTLALSLIIVSTSTAAPGDWPQWRGPHRDGISRETGWSSQGPSASLWEKQLGLGYSGIVIAGDRLISIGYDLEAEEDVVWCLDADSGRTLWSHRYPAAHLANFHGGGTLSTPTIDGEVVYTINRYGRVFCRRLDDGEPIWSRDYLEELELKLTFHGFCASPMLLDDRLYLTLGGMTLAVDKTNGDILWKTKNYGDGSYTNAAPITLGDRDCLALCAGLSLIVIDRATGEEVHSHPWLPKGDGVNCATPLVMGERIFIASAYNLGAALLDLSGKEVQTLWHNRRMRNKIGDCILWENHLYGFDESMLKCLDLEGNEKWRKRGLGMGTLSLSDGRLIILSSKGELVIAEASPEGYSELSRTRIMEGGVYWTTPVLHDGRIYCRNSLGHLVCRDHRSGTDALVATTDSLEFGAMPEAGELFATHVESIGGESAWRAHQSIHIKGEIKITGAGLTGSTMTIDRLAPDKWRLAHTNPMAGMSYRVYDGEIGWQLDPFYGNFLYEGDQLREIRQTRRVHLDLEYETAYASMNTTGTGEFGDRLCWVVEAETTEGHARTLYFDRESGLLVGREGTTEAMVIFADYETFDDVKVPTRVTMLIPDTGAEENYYVETVTFDDVDPAVFERTAGVLRLLRSPELIEAENKIARQQFARYLGGFVANFDVYEDAIFGIVIDDGSLAISFPGQGAYPLDPPDENGYSSIAQFEGVGVTFLENENGVITSIRFHAMGEEHELPRVKSDD